jgi:hypothetical protein
MATINPPNTRDIRRICRPLEKILPGSRLGGMPARAAPPPDPDGVRSRPNIGADLCLRQTCGSAVRAARGGTRSQFNDPGV